MSSDTIITIIAYAISIGTMYGKLSAEIKSLRRDVEKHNGVIERQYDLEKRFEAGKEHFEGKFDMVEKEIEMHHPK